MKSIITNSAILLLFTILSFKSFSQKFTAKTIICEGEDLVLKAEGAERYIWKGPNNFVSNNQNPTIKNVNYLNGGDYNVSFISLRDTITMAFRVKLYSKISLNPSYTITGDNLNIFSNINSQNNLQYVYSWTGSNLFTSTTSNIKINGFTNKDLGKYVLSVRDNESKCANTSNLTINTVNSDCPYQFKKYVVKKDDLGNNYFTPYNTPLIICNTNELVFATDSVENASYQWIKGGVAIPNSNSNILKVTQEGNYEVKIKVGNCSYEIEDSNKLFSILDFKNLTSDISTNTAKIGDKVEGCIGATYFQTKNRNFDNLNLSWLYEGQLIGTTGIYPYHYPQKTGSYQLKILTKECVIFSDPINFVANSKALAPIKVSNGIADLTKDTVKICRGSNVVLYSPNASFWFRNDTLINSLSSVEITKSGRYSFKSFVQACAYDPKKTSVYFKVGDTENAIIQSDNVIINASFFGKNVSAKSNISKPQKYLWNQEFVGETERNSSFVSGNECGKNNSNSTYQVKVIGKDCQAISDKININQVPFRLNLIDENTKTSTILCKGSQVRLQLSEDILRFDSDASIKIIWRLNGNPLKNSNGEFSREYYASEAGVYDCQLVSSKCSITSSSYTVTLKEVVKKPKISIAGCENELTRIKVENVENIKFSWSENFQAQPKYDNLTTLLVAGGGVYKVITQSDNCNNESEELRVTNMGIEAPPVILACIGKSIDILCAYGRDVKWTGPNGFKSTLQTITFADIKATNAGIYIVTDTNPIGCKTSATVEIKTPQHTFSDNPIKNRCEGYYFDSFGEVLSQFVETKWTGPNGYSSTTSDSFMFGVKPSDSGIYTFEYRTLEGCTGKFNRELQVQPITKIDIDNIEVCEGKKSVKLPGVQPSLFYSWSSPQRINQYNWSGLNNFSSTQKTPLIQNFSSDKVGTYILYVRTLSGCKATGTTFVKINEKANTYTPQKVLFCSGIKEFQLKPSSEIDLNRATFYSWTGPNGFSSKDSSPIIKVLPNQKIEGTYELTFLTLDSCISKYQTILELNEAITYLPSQKQSICSEDSIRLLPNIRIESLYNSFSWKGPNGFTASKLNPFLKTKSKNKITGDYELTLTNEYGCLSKSILTIEKNDPISLILPNKNISVCEGTSALVDVDTKFTDSTEYAYLYISEKSIKKTSTDYETKTHYIEPNSSYKKLSLFDKMDVSKEGYYKIKAQSYYSGCPSIDSVKVTLNKSADCKAISLIEIENRKRCTGSTIEVPFKTVGKFEANTTFTVYGILAESGETIVLGKGTKSPISIIINHPYSPYGVNYYIKSSDNVYSEITDYRNYLTTIQEPYTSIDGERLACKESILTFNFRGQNKLEVSNIQWFKDDKIIEKETGFSYLASASGNYKVNYTYQSCQFTTGSIWDFDGEKEFRTNGYPIKIGEIQKPYINTANYGNNPFTICEGTNIILFTDSLYRVYDPKLSVSQKWKFNNEFIKDADKKSYVATKQGEYIFEITEGSCKNQSEPFKILINDNKKADIRIIAPISQFKNGENLVCKGTNCYLNVSDFPPQKNDSLQIKKDNELIKQGKTFQWYRNGVLIKSKNSPLLKITESGDYKLRMTDGQCLIYSENFKIKILEVMPTYVSNNENGLTSSCESGTVDLYKGYNYQGEFRNIYGQLINISNSSTLWFKNGKIIENLGPNSDYRLTSTESGNYHFKIKSFYTDNSTCEFISDTVKVKIEGKQFEILPFDVYKSIQTCRDTIQINYSYSSNSLRPLNYQWKKDGKPVDKANDYNLFVTESGNYSLETIYKGGCKSIGLPMKVNMKELSVSIDEYGSRCEDNYLNLSATTNNYYKNATYQWLKDGKVLANQISQQLANVKDEGKYLVKAKYKTCEATSKELDFVINKIPALLTPNDSARFCPNNSVKINASRGKGFIYEWYQNNNLWVDRNTDSVSVNESGKYKVLIQRDNCSVVSKPVTVFEKLILPSAQISTVKNQIYYGDSTTVKINLTGDSPWSLKLSDGKNLKVNSSPYLFNVSPLKTTTYVINEVKNNCGIGIVQGEAKIEVLILGTQEEQNLFLKVYPIPTTAICNIDVEIDTPEQLKIVITDVLGRNIIEKESVTKLCIFHEQVDLSHFKEGVYFLNVLVGEKKLVRKIIKN